MKTLFLALAISGSVFAKSAPPFSAEILNGGRFILADHLKGKNHILLSFWASWCVPCLEELRHVQEFTSKEKELPLEVMAVNTDTSETSTDVKPTIKLHKLTFPVIMDPTHEILNKYVADSALPFSVLINPSGEIEATFHGYNEGMFKTIQDAIKKNAR